MLKSNKASLLLAHCQEWWLDILYLAWRLDTTVLKVTIVKLEPNNELVFGICVYE